MKTGDDWIKAPERTVEEMGQIMLIYLERIDRYVRKLGQLPREIAELEWRVRRLERREKLHES